MKQISTGRNGSEIGGFRRDRFKHARIGIIEGNAQLQRDTSLERGIKMGTSRVSETRYRTNVLQSKTIVG